MNKNIQMLNERTQRVRKAIEQSKIKLNELEWMNSIKFEWEQTL